MAYLMGKEEETDYEALRPAFDDDDEYKYMLECGVSYKAHILNMCKKGFTHESFTPARNDDFSSNGFGNSFCLA